MQSIHLLLREDYEKLKSGLGNGNKLEEKSGGVLVATRAGKFESGLSIAASVLEF